MGLLISIFRPAHFADCTNNGISSRARDAKGLCLVNVDGPFKPSADYPPALLVEHLCFGPSKGRRLVKIVEAVEVGPGAFEQRKGWTMFGGHFGSTSDSRFREAIEKLLLVEPGEICPVSAVQIHDRYE